MKKPTIIFGILIFVVTAIYGGRLALQNRVTVINRVMGILRQLKLQIKKLLVNKIKSEDFVED